MIKTIALILLLISVSGMGFIIVRKGRRPDKTEGKLEEGSSEWILPDLQLKKRLSQVPYLKNLKAENWLKKILLKTKIFFLKCENMIDVWLNRVSYSKKFNDDYWDKLTKK